MANPSKLLELARAQKIELAVCDAILDETVRVFSIEFGVSVEAVIAHRLAIASFTSVYRRTTVWMPFR